MDLVCAGKIREKYNKRNHLRTASKYHCPYSVVTGMKVTTSIHKGTEVQDAYSKKSRFFFCLDKEKMLTYSRKIFTVCIQTQPLEHTRLQRQVGHTPTPNLSQACEVAVRKQDACVVTYNKHI